MTAAGAAAPAPTRRMVRAARMSDDDRESRRPTARVIFERVKEDAEDELARPDRALSTSALFAGFTLGAAPMAVAVAVALLTGGNEKLVASLFYPIGYVAVIVGRGQLFTENTLYPVVSSLEDPRKIPRTLRLWAVVLAGNLAGGAAFAAIAVKTGALPHDAVTEFVHLGDKAASRAFADTFWSALLTGWLLALVAWVIEGADEAISQIAVIWLLTFPVALASLDHSVASAITVLGALFDGRVRFGEAVGWEGTTILANIVGGVMIVALINYGQVATEAAEEESGA